VDERDAGQIQHQHLGVILDDLAHRGDQLGTRASAAGGDNRIWASQKGRRGWLDNRLPFDAKPPIGEKPSAKTTVLSRSAAVGAA
jgi:hypothetical protein